MSKGHDQGHVARIYPLGLWAPSTMFFPKQRQMSFFSSSCFPKETQGHPVSKATAEDSGFWALSFLLPSYPLTITGKGAGSQGPCPTVGLMPPAHHDVVFSPNRWSATAVMRCCPEQREQETGEQWEAQTATCSHNNIFLAEAQPGTT